MGSRPASLRPAVFLDRDGTLNAEVDFVAHPSELVLLPGVPAALRELERAGFATILVTNQSGIARGMFDEARLSEIHRELERQLAQGGARLDAVYYCPHHPTEGAEPYRRTCECRKPAPGMLARAAREHGLDLARSFVIGDSLRDLRAGAALGVPGILVTTGKGESERAHLAELLDPPPEVARDLGEAVALVLARTRRAPPDRRD